MRVGCLSIKIADGMECHSLGNWAFAASNCPRKIGKEPHGLDGATIYRGGEFLYLEGGKW